MPPHDQTVEKLFDGHHLPAEIAAALPKTSKELFTDEFLQQVRNPTGTLQRKLRALDTTCDWRPEVPVRVYHSRGDRDVWFEHAQYCQGRLRDNGAYARLTDLGTADHNTSVGEALPLVIRQFGSNR